MPPSVQRSLREMVGTVVKVRSVGKRLHWRSGERQITIHLGMTGRFQLTPVPERYRAHHFATFMWGDVPCHFLDFRRFATIQHDQGNATLGIGGYNERRGFYLTGRKQLRVAILKGLPGYITSPRISWLLRHGKETGVGNYMANEALGRLGLSPYSPCVNLAEAERVLACCQKIARASYRAGGTSFGIGYYRLDGSLGTYSNRFQYYRVPTKSRRVFRNRPVYSNFIPAACLTEPKWSNEKK